MRLPLVCIGLLALLPGMSARGQDAHEYMTMLLQHEESASVHRGRYAYMSEERSDRTSGRLWTEKVVETPQGRVRMLLREDGQALGPERVEAEKARLAADARNPDDFARREAAQKNDEEHAKQMLLLLPKAFLFDPPVMEGNSVRINFKPNPDYSPQSMEERVLHGMTGMVRIDKSMVRLRSVEGRLPEDVGLGFGPFATVKAGSNFSTVREHVDGPDWKTETVHTDINGRALFLKTLARKQDLKRWDYRRVGDALTVAQAVELAEK